MNTIPSCKCGERQSIVRSHNDETGVTQVSCQTCGHGRGFQAEKQPALAEAAIKADTARREPAESPRRTAAAESPRTTSPTAESPRSAGKAR